MKVILIPLLLLITVNLFSGYNDELHIKKVVGLESLTGKTDKIKVYGDYAVVNNHYLMDYRNGIMILKKGNDSVWNPIQVIEASELRWGEYYGCDIDIYNNFIAVGAKNEILDTGEGAVYIYKKNGNENWEFYQKITPIEVSKYNSFGSSIKFSSNCLVIGAEDYEEAGTATTGYNSGAVYTFELNQDGYWVQKQKIVPSDFGYYSHFGSSLSISGEYLLIGAKYDYKNISSVDSVHYAGSAYLYRKLNNNLWVMINKFVAENRTENGQFGYSVCINGDKAIIGAIYDDSKDDDGNNLIENSGSAYIYHKDKFDNWNLIKKVIASDRKEYDKFGYSVLINDTIAAIGAPSYDHISTKSAYQDIGSAYVFKLTGDLWSEQNKIISKKINTSGAEVGSSIAISD